MNRKTLTALVILGVLIVAAVVVLRQPEKGERVGDRPRPIAKLPAGSFDTLTVTKGASTTTIKKTGDKYEITAPVTYPADDTVAKQAFEALEKLEFSDVVSDQKAKHAEFELDDKALKVTVKKGDQVVADLLIGKSVGGNTLVRVPGKDEVWQALGSFKYNFDRDATNWRDRNITKFNLADAEKITIKDKSGGHATFKKEAGDKWSVVESSPPIPKLDDQVAPGIVSTMAAWTTNEFADGVKPEDTGLATPNTTITVDVKGGKPVTVMFGNKKGDDEVYAKTADSPQVFVLKRYNADRVNRRPIDFRDKTVCDIPDAEMGEQVAAFVRPAAGRSPDPDRLAAFCREHLAAYKTPRIWQIVDDFPQTASGKIQKFMLRDGYLASREGSGAAPTGGRSATT